MGLSSQAGAAFDAETFSLVGWHRQKSQLELAGKGSDSPQRNRCLKFDFFKQELTKN
jgi:hypothetical protein